MEIEIYYYSKGHPDIFTHSDEIQLKRGCWYFHKKEGSFKGLDITFGDGASYGGILLRAIESLDNSVYIEGPSKLVDEILRLHGHKKVRDLLNDELDLCVEIKNNPNAIKGIYKYFYKQELSFLRGRIKGKKEQEWFKKIIRFTAPFRVLLFKLCCF